MNNKRNIKFVSVILTIMLIVLNLISAKDVKAEDSPYKYITQWGTKGTDDGQFNEPAGVAVDSKGNVYVADSCNSRIQKFDSNGKFITKWSVEKFGPSQMRGDSDGVAVDPKGNVYFIDGVSKYIQKFDSCGKYITKWGMKKDPSDTDNPEVSDYAIGIAADPKGNVYVVDAYNGSIQKFDSSGKFITQWVAQETWGTIGSDDYNWSYPSDVAVDTKGNVYVVDGESYSGSSIKKYDSSGKFITKWGTREKGDYEFLGRGRKIAVDTKGNVYVVEGAIGCIKKFDSTGKSITEWGAYGIDTSDINNLGGIAVDSAENVYVADIYNTCIQKFSINGNNQSNNQEVKCITQSLIANIGSNLNLNNYFTLDSNTLNNLVWASNDNSIATVNNGVVSALRAGTVTITATGNNGAIYGKFTINVELKKDNLVLRDGENTDLTNYLNLSSNIASNITWSSSDNGIATVNNGVIIGLKNGTVTITAAGSDGTQYGVFTVDIVTNDITSSTLGTIRLGGNDRYETSAKISQAGWKESSTYAVLATGRNYPDALSAAPLAKKYNAPILLTDTNSIPQEILDELNRLKVNHVFIAGGTGVVSQTVENKLKSMGITVERFGGKDRFETSVKIAEKLGVASGSMFVTNGYEFADALSASSIAAKMNMPILITDKDTLPDVVKNFINENNFSKTYVLGDTNLVSDKVDNLLPSPERITGSTIYERNINLIKKFQNNIDFSNICIATGENFPDALSGSALATMVSSAIVLVDNNDLQDITKNYSNQESMQVNNVYVFGEQGAVSDEIIKELFNK